MTNNLKAARQALGLSLRGLADALGYADRQTIRRYESGARPPSPRYLAGLEALLWRNCIDPGHFGLPSFSVAK